MSTTETYQTKIAEFVGWTRISLDTLATNGKSLWVAGAVLKGTPPRDKDKPDDDQAYEVVPMYATDLNAMHEGEKALNGFQAAEYCTLLGKAAQAKITTNGPESTIMFHRAYIGASIEVRCEAFLKVINK